MIFQTPRFIIAGILILMGAIGAISATAGAPSTVPPAQDNRSTLATCLTEKGWVIYTSSTCPACRAQRRAFGKAFQYIQEVECNPHAPNSQVEQCINKKIKNVPTWIWQEEGEEVRRVMGYQPLKKLADLSGCKY